MDEFSEQRIAAGLRAGDRQAWSQLYRAYAHRLWREVARLSGGDRGGVADVVQETFLAAARSAGRFDPKRGSLWTWLWGIARKQLAMHRRREGRHRLAAATAWWASLGQAGAAWLAGTADAPPDALASKELGELVRATLLELPEDYRALLTARHLDGASPREIAAEQGVTAEAVRAKLTRARKAFRKAFAALAGDDKGPSEPS